MVFEAFRKAVESEKVPTNYTSLIESKHRVVFFIKVDKIKDVETLLEKIYTVAKHLLVASQ